MRLARQTFFCGMIPLILLSGCTRMEKVRAIGEGEDLPYESLGSLEVKAKAHTLTPSGTFWNSVELLTLGFAPTPSRGERYKSTLRSKLVRRARERYGAHEVIHVTYWPDPESKSFPEGVVYARGEMIRYYPFPPASSEITETVSLHSESAVPLS